MIRIETDRLVLRRMQDSDLQAYVALDNQPGHCQYLSRSPCSEEQAGEFIAVARDLPLGTQGRYLHLAVEVAATRMMIGTVCIKVDSEPHHQGDVGWFLRSDQRGQGLATEASRALLTFSFDALHLHRITAHCDVMNTRSRAMMERLGMRQEGHYRGVAFYDDVWHDQYCYAIVRDEWEDAQAH